MLEGKKRRKEGRREGRGILNMKHVSYLELRQKCGHPGHGKLNAD